MDGQYELVLKPVLQCHRIFGTVALDVRDPACMEDSQDHKRRI